MTDLEQKPRLRFKGFTEAWEQRKLGELSSIVGGGTPSTAINTYWNGTINWFSPAEINEQNYVFESHNKITKEGLEHSSAKMLPVGTLLFTSRAGIGKTAILAIEACTNQGFQSIVPIKGCLDSYFIYSCTNQLKKYGEIKGAGSTFVEVSGRQMSEMPLMLPFRFTEQEKIGQLFYKLDSLITLHQRKYEKLKSMKTALLEKMFPAGNDTTPKIRFKGFTEAWEQRKVGLLVDLYESKTKIENEYPVLSSTMSGIFLQKDYFNQEVSTITNAGYKIVPYGFITYRSMSDTDVFHFNVQNIVEKGIVSPAYPVFSTKEKVIDSYFLTYQMNNSFSFFKQLILLKEGGTRYALSFKKLSEIMVAYPCFNEQEKIAKLLKDLDSLITLHQRKCEKLKNLKKSLLERMFI